MQENRLLKKASVGNEQTLSSCKGHLFTPETAADEQHAILLIVA